MLGFRSFACYTIQQRLPTIITKIIDGVTRDKNELIELFGGDVIDNNIFFMNFPLNAHNNFFFRLCGCCHSPIAYFRFEICIHRWPNLKSKRSLLNFHSWSMNFKPTRNLKASMAKVFSITVNSFDEHFIKMHELCVF